MSEIRTFVYRTEKARKQAGDRLGQLKKKVLPAAASVAVLVALITTVSVIASDRKQIIAETVPAEYTFHETAALAGAFDTVVSDEVTYTNISKKAADHKDLGLYGWLEAEEDDGLILLGLDTDDEQANVSESTADTGDVKTFIPEETGTYEPEESVDGKDVSPVSQTGKTQEKTDAPVPPKDAPDRLVYTYNPDMILDLDAENLEALERIVEAEACDQDLFGKILVANVVINRVYAGFADTVKGVIFQKLGGSVQFSPVRKGGSYYTVKVSEESKEAVRRALSGEDYSQGAIYFFQRSTTSARKAAWFDRDLKFLFKYGTHEFFKEKH